ncbi:MAG: DUF3343 domain-containing protein [Eubacteriales bacterium]|nr:DUF3343 domain-containing protein [Eubacteriales bacterium]
MPEPFAFAAFRSRQAVMEYESRLKQAGLTPRIINTPHEVALGCGLSVQFDEGDYEKARAVYDTYRPESFVGFYRARYQNGKMLCETLAKYRA